MFLATALLGVASAGVHRKRWQKRDQVKGGDPRETGPPYARNRTIDRAHIGLKKPVQNINRAQPPEARSVFMRQPLTTDAAKRIQHVLAITQRRAPLFFEPKSAYPDRQLYYNTLPVYHPSYTRIEVTHQGRERRGMPVAPLHAVV